MVDISRHRDVVNPNNFNEQIHIIGCGATGSHIATILVKMGFSNLNLYDFDVVNDHNLANQAYGVDDVGKFKVEALKNHLTNINNDAIINISNEEVNENNRFSGIVFLLTDTMASRKEIYNSCAKNKINVKLLIETRMSSDSGIIYTVNPMSYLETKYYDNTLSYTDSEAEVSFCGTSITVLPTALSIASNAVWQLINYINGDDYQSEVSVNYKTNQIFTQDFKKYM